MVPSDNAANAQQSITLTGIGINVSGRRQGWGVHRELLMGPIVAIRSSPEPGPPPFPPAEGRE